MISDTRSGLDLPHLQAILVPALILGRAGRDCLRKVDMQVTNW